MCREYRRRNASQLPTNPNDLYRDPIRKWVAYAYVGSVAAMRRCIVGSINLSTRISIYPGTGEPAVAAKIYWFVRAFVLVQRPVAINF